MSYHQPKGSTMPIHKQAQVIESPNSTDVDKKASDFYGLRSIHTNAHFNSRSVKKAVVGMSLDEIEINKKLNEDYPETAEVEVSVVVRSCLE